MEGKMKKQIVVTGLILACVIAGGITVAEEVPSAEKGQTLFNDPALSGSTNDRSCGSCHPGGQGLEHSGKLEHLAVITNQCITGPMKGKKLNDQSPEMQSIILYMNSLGE
jgi:cytochrome c peroxidase